MKAGSLVAFAILALSACARGPSDHQVLVESCVANGETEVTCSCIADAMQKNLSKELFTKTADAVGREKKDMMSFVGELTVDEQMSFSAVLGDMFACSLTGEGGE
ncbi:hypothetical protein K1X12_10575 [Hyphomonas sp. WL0036]|uniref:hypothetical protein n=1 Tax=Hyphomonas sediminis TaxID=2866160 RepID=UPI001C7F7209|nr:hypothetical protein [Hyphomonas sediminis]MBY9067346.1 hypothetical protein [Hyphomonas sediminis]